MKPTTLLTTALAALAATAPVPDPVPQLGLSGAQNGVTQGSCKAVTLIFARGTFELSNMGNVVGPGLAQDLAQAVGADALAVQGVNYAADVGGIFAEITGGAGTQAMLSVAQQALAKCPDTKLVLSGYSQGAMLVHNTAGRMGEAAGKVVAAVTFGDPFKSVALKGISAEKFKTFCATGDPVCGLGGVSALSGMVSSGGDQSSSMASHLGYGADAPAAAKFIQSRLGA